MSRGAAAPLLVRPQLRLVRWSYEPRRIAARGVRTKLAARLNAWIKYGAYSYSGNRAAETVPMNSQRFLTFVFAAATLALYGCSDSVQQDVAKCKLKAIELYRPVQIDKLWSAEPLRYVEECMLATGYRLNVKNRDCTEKSYRSVLPYCWYRETWWQRFAHG
jgi:hypothetical protein